MPAMQMGHVLNSKPAPEAAEYMRRCAEGGVSLIISEGCAPEHPSSHWQPIFCVLDMAAFEGWKRVVDAVKTAGAHFFMQLWHPGAIRLPVRGMPHTDYPSLSPSGLIQAGRPNGRAATLMELEDIKAAFVTAAVRSKSIGADGVEIHSCHGYFLDQFLWSQTNQREDRYGGSTVVERARYPAEIVSAIRSAVGDDFCISFRYSQFKEVNYGAKTFAAPDELKGFLGRLADSGVDCFNVSSRRFYQPEWPELDPNLGFAGWSKKNTNRPVITCGSVGLSADMCQDAFDNAEVFDRSAADLLELRRRFLLNEFDLAAVGRMHIANADLVKKIRSGKTDEIELYSKTVHLAHLLKFYEGGPVEDKRVVAD